MVFEVATYCTFFLRYKKVVAHGGLNRAVLMNAMELPVETYGDPSLRFPNCGVAELEVAATPLGAGSRCGLPRASRWRWLASASAGTAGVTSAVPQPWRSIERR